MDMATHLDSSINIIDKDKSLQCTMMAVVQVVVASRRGVHSKLAMLAVVALLGMLSAEGGWTGDSNLLDQAGVSLAFIQPKIQPSEPL